MALTRGPEGLQMRARPSKWRPHATRCKCAYFPCQDPGAIVGVPWRGSVSACLARSEMFVKSTLAKVLKRPSLLRHHGTFVMAHLQLPEPRSCTNLRPTLDSRLLPCNCLKNTFCAAAGQTSRSLCAVSDAMGQYTWVAQLV